MAISFGPSLAVILIPDATQHMRAFLKHVITTLITLAWLSAIALSLILPKEQQALSLDSISPIMQRLPFAVKSLPLPRKSERLPLMQ